jgi:TetR/AcrR family transcriptional regulator, regulator of cefoperazone and chloramphenicol sensitivity
MFRKLYMRSEPADQGDLRARAVIRDQALRLFADHGPDAVSLRRVAAAAGVSPALVVHHFGSRAGLREAVDGYVAGVFHDLFAAMGDADFSAPDVGGSFAELITSRLPADSPVPVYLRRLLLAGDDAGRALFRRWYELTAQMLDGMAAAGMIRPSADPQVRAAFLMVNDLAVFLMRDQLTAVLGVDPLSAAGVVRWTEVLLSVYRDGVFNSADGEGRR